jgi:hypothetical protein
MSLSFFTPTKAIRVPGISCIGARMYFGNDSSFQVMPETCWRGVVEALEGTGLAAVDAVERRPELDFWPFPMSWQGEQKRLNTCSPAAHPAPSRPVEAARAIPAITHVLIIFSSFPTSTAPAPPMPASENRMNPQMASADLQRSPCSNGVNGLQVNRPSGQFVSPRGAAYLAEWARFVPRCRYKFGVTMRPGRPIEGAPR